MAGMRCIGDQTECKVRINAMGGASSRRSLAARNKLGL